MASLKLYRVGLVLCLIGVILYIIGFSTPYWIASYQQIQVESKFVNLGLWTACFAGYVHPQDYYGAKPYFGCWWILSKEYFYIRDWLMPHWFYACQVLSVITLLLYIIAAALTVYHYARRFEHPSSRLCRRISYVLFLLSLTELPVLIIFGDMSRSLIWLPLPFWNYLSWSYGLTALSLFASFFGGLCLYVFHLQVVIDKREEDTGIEAYTKPIRS